MSARQLILRYNHILNKLSKGPATFSEIDQYLTLQSSICDEAFNVSKRQFQRDIRDISSIFELEIYFDKASHVYRINDAEFSEISRRRIEALDTFNALKIGDGASKFILFEPRKATGTENLSTLVYAIRNRFELKFSYQKYWENESSVRQIEPLALKEFKSRWYVIGRDKKDLKIKSFALDRISNLENSGAKFIPTNSSNVKDSYQHCFGIIGPNGLEPQKVILSFDPIQGKYIKSLPLHQSQKIVVENPSELRIEIDVYITYDLVMEILSYGEYVRVIEPQSLVREISNTLECALMQYQQK